MGITIMKNKPASRIYATVSRILKVRQLLDFDRNKNFLMYLMNALRTLVAPQETNVPESFQQAVVRLNLTDELLQKQKNSLFRLCLLMSFFGFCVFIYTIYLLFMGTWLAAITSLMVMSLSLVLAFRYHFWYFQIMQKKLGCTFKEWLNQSFLRGSNEK